MAKRILTVITSCIAFSAVLILGDWINIAYLLGLDISSLNWDFIALLIGNIVVVALYLITYIAIDRNNVVRSENQVRSTKIILKNIYSQCKEFIELIENEYLRKMAAKKCDFNKTEHEDPAMTRFQDHPFELEDHVFIAVNNGVLSEQEFDEFINIRKRYKKYVSNRISFFDAENQTDNPTIQVIADYLKEEKQSLISLLSAKIASE